MNDQEENIAAGIRQILKRADELKDLVIAWTIIDLFWFCVLCWFHFPIMWTGVLITIIAIQWYLHKKWSRL
jgi:hypothetical protein